MNRIRSAPLRSAARNAGSKQFLRAAWTWDDMPLTLERAYRSAGRQAQEAFRGGGREDSSMLVQIALLARQAS